MRKIDYFHIAIITIGLFVFASVSSFFVHDEHIVKGVDTCGTDPGLVGCSKYSLSREVGLPLPYMDISTDFTGGNPGGKPYKDFSDLKPLYLILNLSLCAGITYFLYQRRARQTR